MSAPAQKLAPAPVNTTTRACGLPAIATSAACSSCIVAPSSALCLSGRFSVSVATPRASTVVLMSDMATSGHLHSEHAVAFHARLRSAHRGADRLTEYASCVDRIDDAVVPQARSRVVRIALRFVLPADLAHECLALLVRPLLVARFQAVATHGREH